MSYITGAQAQHTLACKRDGSVDSSNLEAPGSERKFGVQSSDTPLEDCSNSRWYRVHASALLH